ncbi:substrate-binding domain-containing protein [Halobaculum lipolyticum]|uniref:Substrate-binding domain-containing protein n=1 Tax=Halobaculum lipolyticum TaxID=3032001 RepID=A0ABD5WAE9_9EURY|nr:substrate-binding domain-containing protein [Halobaculum sp. DT31]
MTKQRSGDTDGGATRRGFLAAAGAGAAAVGLAGCTGGTGGSTEGDGDGDAGGGGDDSADGSAGGDTGTESSAELEDAMTIFHAGSLAPPFSEAEPAFEEEYGVDVTREAQGSVASTQKITQQGRAADVLGTSDFRLIRDRMLGEFADWYAIFTTNAMSIQYREDSPGADDIGADNWWEVLTRDDVVIGHSDPAVDPGGYRAVMTQQLGAEPFEGERLYDDATYERLRENSTVPTGTETNLEGQLESGELDYVFYYQSISASSGLPYVELQPEVDLSQATSAYAEHYAKAAVETSSGTFTGAPIAYGITSPSVAESPNAGAEWVEYFATEPGRAVLEELGLVPVDPIVVPAAAEDAVPENVASVASAQETLGPLEL